MPGWLVSAVLTPVAVVLVEVVIPVLGAGDAVSAVCALELAIVFVAAVLVVVVRPVLCAGDAIVGNGGLTALEYEEGGT